MKPKTKGRFTGRHMAAIIVGFFAVVIAVNLLMARLATSTFGGVVVENSYVASQNFNQWLEEADAARALGWRAEILRRDDGRIAASLANLPEGPATVTALARHPLGRQPDQPLSFARQADGLWLSTGALPVGRWRLRLEVSAAGHIWRHEEDVS
ncbi:MAG: FixH family protein [Novosphingobium sp.]|nr:FixH family protein [Novosphingobium sp.]